MARSPTTNPAQGAAPTPADLGADTPIAAAAQSVSELATSSDAGFGSEASSDALPEVEPPRYALVWDGTAKRLAREHEIAGNTFVFQPNQPTRMLLDDALTIVHIPSFTVRDAIDGSIYQPARQAIEKGAEALHMRNDQVIATLDELTIVALNKRAMTWSDHPEFPSGMSRQLLKVFIMERLAEPAPPPKKARDGGRFVHIDAQGRMTQMTPGDDDDEPDFDPRSDGEALTVDDVMVREAVQRSRVTDAQLAALRRNNGYN